MLPCFKRNHHKKRKYTLHPPYLLAGNRRLPSGPREGRSHQLAALFLRGASWSALPGSRPSHLHEAGRGVNGFGSFCRNKRASPAGAKPGNSENHVDTRSGHIGEKRLTPNAFFFWKSQDRFLRHIVKLLGRNHQCHMIRYLSMRVPLNRGGALGRRMGCVDRIKGAA